ncbi:MAG TPA: protein kinase [Polyangiales bacterium]|nr:protein kinase [Polyangiales bacterium]
MARIEHDMRITGQGTIVGTPEYIAPEQIHTAAAMPSADLYSLGCVLFEMLTGRLPFEGKTTILLVKHLNDPPPTPSSLQPSIPAGVDQLVLRLLQKEPSQRFRDAYHLVEALQQLLDELPGVRAGLPGDGGDSYDEEGIVPGPTEEESLSRAIELYRSLLHDAHTPDLTPSWLPQAIEYLENTLTEVQLLRQRLREAAERATDEEEETRGPRDRIGRALDELAKDESRLSRVIASLTDALRASEERLDRAMCQVFESASSPVQTKAGRALNDQEVLVVGKLVEGARRLASERERTLQLRSELDARKTEHNDLRFQIAELKEQLSALQGAATVDQQLTHDEVTRLSAQIQAKLEAVAPYSNRVALHFSQFPSLRQRLSGPAPDGTSNPG